MLQIWIIFLIAVYVSRLGGIKLGKPTDEPEYPTASWFMMMFSAGIGIGLFFFGVAEPVMCAPFAAALRCACTPPALCAHAVAVLPLCI